MVRFKVNSTSVHSISLKKISTLEYILGNSTLDLAALALPDCPDADPFQIVPLKSLQLNTQNLVSSLLEVLPEGEYEMISCASPKTVSKEIWLGQAKVPTHDRMRILFKQGSYYGVVFIGEGERFPGAVLLAVCVPDSDTGLCEVLLIRIASTESNLIHIVIPQHDAFCLFVYDITGSNSSASANLRKWYVEQGAKELTKIVDQLPVTREQL